MAFIDEWLTPLGARGPPRDRAQRGSHVALVSHSAGAIPVTLDADGVIPDFRTPDVIRLGLSPLTTRFTDVYDGLDRVRRLLS